jgi:hypothetical protein
MLNVNIALPPFHSNVNMVTALAVRKGLEMVAFSKSFERRLATGKARAGNGGTRPNSHQRRSNKRHMLSPSAGFGGNGVTVPCSYCQKDLSFEAIEADRIIPGAQGGDYKRSNLIPACRVCNSRRGDTSLWSFAPKLARRLVARGITVSVKSGS